MKVLFVYITCEDRVEAEKIGEHLLKKRLVACVNIIDRMHSMYLWPSKKGKVEEADETILLCKTLDSKWKVLVKEVEKIHSYSIPEIAAIPVTHINKKYFDWLVKELE